MGQQGPLAGVRVVELAGIGPAPFGAMLLADLGADVVRVDRPETVPEQLPVAPHLDLVGRGRRSVAVDLKASEGVDVVLDLLDGADVLVEGFRPGVMERLALGPDVCSARNPRLVYARMTGWGQDGPQARYAGHDLDYIAVTGALAGIVRNPADGTVPRPVPPLNLLGDLGGGALFLVVGILAALHEVGRSGRGQVVDAAIVDGTSVLTTFVRGLRAQGLWSEPPGHNALDTGAAFYEVYECADGRHLAVAALEPRFYGELVALLGTAGVPVEGVRSPALRLDPSTWPRAKQEWAALFATRTRDEWCELLERSDACVAPVLDLNEAPRHPHLVARQTFVEHAGTLQPGPAPRFSRTRLTLDRPPAHPGEHTDAVLRDLGYDESRVAGLRRAGVIR